MSRKDTDGLLSAYTNVLEEGREPKTSKVIQEKNEMKIGTIKQGDLEGPAEGVSPKKSGPADADGFEQAVEAPKEFSPAAKKNSSKKKKLNKESNIMSFDDLYKSVIVNEEDLESAEYDDEMGDFPPAEGEMADEGEERSAGDILGEVIGLLQELQDTLGGGSDLDMEDDLEAPMQDEDPTFGEATSEPEPKEFNANISQLQAPRSLGGQGVRVSQKKAKSSTISKKHSGDLETAPKGFTPGNKGMMKVSGTGPAIAAKNASAFED